MASPTASDFPQLLNSSILAGFETNAPLSSTSSQPSFASGAAEDQLASSTHSLAGNAILNAASIFLTASSFPSSRVTINGAINGQAVSSTNNTQHWSVLSSVSSTSTTTSIAPNTNADLHAAEVHMHTENNLVPSTASVLSRQPAMINHHRASRPTAIVTPRCYTSSSSDKLSSTPLQSNCKAHSFKNDKFGNSTASSGPATSKHRSHKTVNESTITYAIIEQKTSERDDERTTTYTSTVTRRVTVTVPAQAHDSTSVF